MRRQGGRRQSCTRMKLKNNRKSRIKFLYRYSAIRNYSRPWTVEILKYLRLITQTNPKKPAGESTVRASAAVN